MAFPSTGIFSYGPVVDLTTTVKAADVNGVYTELALIETLLGTGFLTSAWDSTAFAVSTTWTSLSDRLTNIERGIKNGYSSAPYLRKDGGTMSAAAGTVTLRVQSASGNTANLINTVKSDGTTIGFSVDKDGIPYYQGTPILYSSTSAATISTQIADLQTQINNLPHPFLFGGM
jgi:hypothetical protein